jgi:uncharacterized membrane protein
MSGEQEVERERARDRGADEHERADEPVWTYRGYELRPSDFSSAMIHLFRAEISRANVWRQRLDSTTNWAVLTTGASISFVFTDPSAHHSVIFINALLLTLFLFIEARRYRYYELWSSRVRLMETDFFATMLVPPFRPAPDWAESLAASLLHPQFTISVREAVGRRLRRNYVWIYLILGVAWILKIWLHPEPASGVRELVQRAAVGSVPGAFVLVGILVAMAAVITFALATVRLRAASGEVVPRFGGDPRPGAHARGEGAHGAAGPSAWFRPSRRRQQFLAIIVTSHAREVSDAVLREMQRGLTALEGRGMYSQQARTVLMCAVTLTEIPAIRSLVRGSDPEAFVIVTPAHEVYGLGFAPLES